MIGAIIILTVAVLVLGIYLISCIIHIGKIQKELEQIDEEQRAQNTDLAKLAHNQKYIITYLTEEEKKKNYWTLMGQGGEA